MKMKVTVIMTATSGGVLLLGLVLWSWQLSMLAALCFFLTSLTLIAPRRKELP